MPPDTPRRRRARPVADAPIDVLLPRAQDLAKGWLLALLEQAPLHEAGGILAAELGVEGPRLCESVLRAIADDGELRRLGPDGALAPLTSRVGEIAGAATPAAVSRAVDALQAVIWSAVRDELRAADADMVAELTERLTLISEQLRTAALERMVADAGRSVAPEPPAPVSVQEPDASPLAPEPAPPAPESEPEPPAPVSEPEPPAPVSEPEPPAPVFAPEPPASPPAAPEPAPAASVPPPASAPPPPAPEPPRWASTLSTGRFEPRRPPRRGARGATDALWVDALEDEIRQAGGTSLSLLLAELEDAERVTAVEPRPEAAATFGRFAGAVRSVVRRQDILVCETDSRAWVIARDTARTGAYSLGERIADAVKHAGEWQGAPLAASIGLAVLGEDGRTAAALIEAAEEARFAAAASGVDVMGDEYEDEDD